MSILFLFHHHLVKKTETKSINAQGQVIIFLLSVRLIGVNFLDLFTTLSSWDLVYTNKSVNSIWEYTNGSSFARPTRVKSMGCFGFEHPSNVSPRVFPCRPIYKLGDLYTSIMQSSNFWFLFFALIRHKTGSNRTLLANAGLENVCLIQMLANLSWV